MANTYVVDASVLVKWELDEAESEYAIALRDDFVNGRIEIIAPALVFYEIASALRKGVLKRRVNAQRARAFLSDLLAMQIPLIPPEHSLLEAFDMAEKQQRSVFDAAYIAIALREQCLYYTGDRRVLSGLGKEFQFVKWIGDYRISPTT